LLYHQPANILVDARGCVKLSDFGIMRDLSESACSETFTGTLPFMSPERIRADKYTTKVRVTLSFHVRCLNLAESWVCCTVRYLEPGHDAADPAQGVPALPLR